MRLRPFLNIARRLGAALTEILSVAVDDTNAASLTTEQLQRHFFFDIDPDATPPDGAVTITVPAIQRGLFAVRNNTAQEVTVTISGESPTAPNIGAGAAVLVSNDGTDVRAASSGIPDLDNSSIGELLDVDISGIAAGQQLSWNGTALVPVTEPFGPRRLGLAHPKSPPTPLSRLSLTCRLHKERLAQRLTPKLERVTS